MTVLESSNGVQHPTIPHAPPPESLPAINVYKLTGADLRSFLALQGGNATMQDKQDLGLELLDRAVEGGLAAIPMPYLGQYVEQLNALLGEAMNPGNSAGGSGTTSGPKGRSRRNS
jgi:hypothetical protein